MFHPHLLVLAASAVLHATITPVGGRPAHITESFPTMAACELVSGEITDSAPLSEVIYTCTKEYRA